MGKRLSPLTLAIPVTLALTLKLPCARLLPSWSEPATNACLGIVGDPERDGGVEDIRDEKELAWCRETLP